MSFTLLLAAAAVLALIYWVQFCHRGASWPKSAVKTISVALLAVAASLSGGPVLLTVALALCALGDYLLSRDSEAQFMAGVGAFAAGHIAYVALFLTHPDSDVARLATVANLGVIAMLAVFGAGMMRLLWSRAGDMRGPVMGYIPVILAMAIAVLAVAPHAPLAWALPAAALFLISDTTLSLDLFVLRDGSARRLAPFVVWPTYWLAQAGFTLAFAL